jgi:exonuclease SbcD
MASACGNLVELAEAIRELAREGSVESPLWLEVQVSGDDYLSDLHARIAALCEGLPVEVLRIRRERGTSAPGLQAEARETLDELDSEEVFARRLQQEQLDADSAQRLQQLYRQVLEQLRDEQ